MAAAGDKGFSRSEISTFLQNDEPWVEISGQWCPKESCALLARGCAVYMPTTAMHRLMISGDVGAGNSTLRSEVKKPKVQSVVDVGGMSLGEIGQRLGLSRERVRQIEQQALRKLRDALEKQGLSFSILTDREVR